MAYVTLADMRSEGVPETYSDARVNNRIALAEQYVHRRTKQWFEALFKTLVFDGRGTDTLFLPIMLISITSITLDDVSLTAAELAEVVNYNRRDIANDDRRRPKLARKGGVWTTGRQNVAVEGSWGFVEEDDSTPLAIVDVVKRLIVRDLDLVTDMPAQRDRREATFATQISTGNRSIILAQIAVSGGPTGDLDIDVALDRFRAPARIW